MKLPFHKYHALQNDFIVIESRTSRIPKRTLQSIVRQICHRKSGIGADGLLLISSDKKGHVQADIYNSDGGWAEKSGNGLRIVGLHLSRSKPGKRYFEIKMGGIKNSVHLIKRTNLGAVLQTELGVPKFKSREVPIRAKSEFMINRPLKVGGVNLPVTCLSIGNPHTVLFVEHFNFDWKLIGAEIECHNLFPNCTNVEFVKVVSPTRLELKEWERGVGATGSSGTGAAAAVSAAVVLGFARRKCKVEFETGSLSVDWRKSDDVLELTGPAEFICEGIFEYK